MRERLIKWYLHRRFVDALGYWRPFSRARRRRLLLVTEAGSICHQQVFPFFYYQRELRERWNLEVRELPLRTFRARPHVVPGPVDVICFQTWFNLSDDALRDLVTQLRLAYPGAKLVYLDWFAPTDLRYASRLADCVDAYLKKNILRDRTQYGRPTVGHTNLTDYFNRRFGLDDEPTLFAVPVHFVPKLVVGWNFAISPYLLRALRRPVAMHAPRAIDVHARFATRGTPWYTRMRAEARDKVFALEGLRVVHAGKVSKRRFMSELRHSKLCFSPFGFGEVCWRDFEAIAAGCVLVKPDMSHIETWPNIYIPYKTYVPVRWDLGDLAAKCREILGDGERQQRIADNARRVLCDYVLGGGAEQHLAEVFTRVFPN